MARPVGDLDRLTYRAGLRSFESLRLPDYMGLGAAQAGSSWLHTNLLRHPHVEPAARKEVRYWSHAPHRSLRFYARSFRGIGAGSKVGDISPDYAGLPEGIIRQIARLLPDLRLFFIIRDPVAVFSQRGAG